MSLIAVFSEPRCLERAASAPPTERPFMVGGLPALPPVKQRRCAASRSTEYGEIAAKSTRRCNRHNFASKLGSASVNVCAVDVREIVKKRSIRLRCAEVVKWQTH